MILRQSTLLYVNYASRQIHEKIKIYRIYLYFNYITFIKCQKSKESQNFRWELKSLKSFIGFSQFVIFYNFCGIDPHDSYATSTYLYNRKLRSNKQVNMIIDIVLQWKSYLFICLLCIQ